MKTLRLFIRHAVLRAFLFGLVLNWLPGAVFAQEQRSTPVGPGVVHRYLYDPKGPWAINVLEVDLSNPYIELETVKARDRLQARERTSAMAARRDWEQHRVIGAINGDFYNPDGAPVGLQVTQGVVVHEPNTRTFFGVFADGRPLLARVSFQGEVDIGEIKAPIHGVNTSRGTNELVLYNAYRGATTLTNRFGAEATLKPVDSVLVNKPVRFVVLQIDSVSGNQPLSDSTWVLSGHGTSRDLLARKVAPGDTLAITLRLPPLLDPLKEAVGGMPRLVRDGRVSVETDIDGGAGFANVRHPRTAVGFSADSTRLWLVTVDGRQPNYSDGMTLYELADLLIDLGVYQGVNLDGGGSTTMVVRGEVVNRPSDAQGERSVSNALLVISHAATDTLSHLRLSPRRVELFSGESIRFEVSGFDQFYNPLDLSAETLFWEVDARVGTITTDGVLTASTRHDSGYVWVRAGLSDGAAVDSAFVVVQVLARVEIQPQPVVLQPGETQQLELIGFDTGGREVGIDLSQATWSVTGGVGEVSSDGVFTATDSGRGWIEVRVDSLVGRAEVLVAVEGEVTIEPFDNLLHWRLDGAGVRLLESDLRLTSESYVTPPTAAALDYSLTRSGGTSVFYLESGLRLGGAPDSVALLLKGDGRPYLVKAEFWDREDELFELLFERGLEPLPDEWTRVAASIQDARANWRNLGAELTPPLRWWRFLIFPGGGAIGEIVRGTILLDDFSAVYGMAATTGVGDSRSLAGGGEFRLLPNFPNPFNRGTEIRFWLPSAADVRLSVFNLRGELVRVLLAGPMPAGYHRHLWAGDDSRGRPVSSGLYFCRLRAKEQRQVRTLVVLR
jgi:hypothetical protein